ncbi:MAG TPA: tRNA preQ1(34) S-adenosylmethionine ribosyltransferase-isomerase QueA [Candidatus Binataceae bacterium]|nr:tRNA preQ1(34) S-adenosylmethionine ribosyltransferase-isomerase QueA [Candidatus Binataceae bacterium]
MRLSELDYELPPELIAQEPLPRRDSARMLVLQRRSGALEHSRFYKLGRYLREGDLLVLNDTRVFPARLAARKPSGGRVELLLVRPVTDPPGGWLALIRGHRPAAAGSSLALEGGGRLRVVACPRPGRVVVTSDSAQAIEELIAQAGRLALPHYIKREVSGRDSAEYQTVYAAHQGAVAAPTAGLHFTPELLDLLRAQGCAVACLTLHIGPGTFVPLRAQEVEQHGMEAEFYSIPPQAAQSLAHARRVGGRVIAVGTSSVRALESYAITGDLEGYTGLFIYPGFRFKLVEGMITNFHMPRSTVLAMVMAFAGRTPVLDAYHQAIRHRYRLLSYGDAMLIL